MGELLRAKYYSRLLRANRILLVRRTCPRVSTEASTAGWGVPLARASGTFGAGCTIRVICVRTGRLSDNSKVRVPNAPYDTRLFATAVTISLALAHALEFPGKHHFAEQTYSRNGPVPITGPTKPDTSTCAIANGPCPRPNQSAGSRYV